jgi:hypothetical protein
VYVFVQSETLFGTLKYSTKDQVQHLENFICIRRESDCFHSVL